MLYRSITYGKPTHTSSPNSHNTQVRGGWNPTNGTCAQAHTKAVLGKREEAREEQKKNEWELGREIPKLT